MFFYDFTSVFKIVLTGFCFYLLIINILIIFILVLIFWFFKQRERWGRNYANKYLPISWKTVKDVEELLVFRHGHDTKDT